MAFRNKEPKKHTKNRWIKIKTWFHDGIDWLEYGVGWNLFPLLVAILLFIVGRAKNPFITAAGTYSMAIFSISSSAIGNAKKCGVRYGLVEFTRILSVLLYVLIFSDFASPVIVSEVDMSAVWQIIFLFLLSLFLVYIINFGVKLERMLHQTDSLHQKQTAEQPVKQIPAEKEVSAGGQASEGQTHPQGKNHKQQKKSSQSKRKGGSCRK